MHFPVIALTTIFGSICDPFFFPVSDILYTPIGHVSEFVLSQQTEAKITERLQKDKMVNRLLGRCIVLDYFYAPNFEQDEEAYWFGPVCACVHP